MTGEPAYAGCFARTLAWIAEHQVDWKNGDWHAEITAEGRPQGQKAGPWKAAYHDGRAVIECLEILDTLIGK
jgi:mannose/cellobiose epimerase-like protein (N-acyl-D-glucosamine 2-epimerase family)